MNLKQFAAECIDAFRESKGEFTPPLRSITKVADKHKLSVTINGKAPADIKPVGELVEDGFFDDIIVVTPLGTVKFNWLDTGYMTIKSN